MPDTADPTGPGPRPRRLRRSTEDRDLAGVLGGLGEALGVESSWLRLAVVATTAYLAFGPGNGAQLLVVLPYAAAWALLPTDRSRPLLVQVPRRAALQELGLIALLVLVSTVVAAQPGLGVVAVLGGAAALLLRDGPDPDRPPGQDAPPPGTTPGAAPGTISGTTPGTVSWAPTGRADETAAPAANPRRHRPPPRPRREPALWPLAAALTTVVGVVTIAGLVAGWAVDVRLVVNLLMAGVGSVMALSAWRGRARVLLLACPVLLLLWFATSAADIGGHDGIGRRRERPVATSSDGTLSYEVGYGVLEVDLTGLELGSGSRTEVDLGVSVGMARVTVPAGARVEVVGEVGLGVVGVASDRWGNDVRLAAHDRLDLRRQPLGPVCETTQVSAPDLRQLAEDAGLAPVPTSSAEGAEGSSGDVPSSSTVGPDATGGPTPTDPPVAVPETPGVDPDPVAASRRADDALLDAIEEAGFPRPRVVDQVQWDDGNGPVTEDLVEAHVSDEWSLCRPQPPDPDPPVVVIDAAIGLGTLEVHRV